MTNHIGLDELAIQEGIRKPWETLLMMTKTAYGLYAFTHRDLEQFAALVAAHEREECAKFIEDEYVRQFDEPWRHNLAAAIRARGRAMNERIKEIAKQAGFNPYNYEGGNAILFSKFAELIVKECCEVLEQTEDALDRQKWPTPRGCVAYIKDHFGVE